MVILELMAKKNRWQQQQQYNREDYGFDVYWFTYFTHVSEELNTERDFKTVIRAHSARKAKEALINKIKRGNPKDEVKALKTYKIHSKFRTNRVNGLSLEQWEAFRYLSFPNTLDRLYLIEKPRKEGQHNYFNRNYTEEELQQLATLGTTRGCCQKGENNWSNSHPVKDLPKPDPKERHLYRSKDGGRTWDKIPEEERRAQKIEIINALIEAQGNRTNAAKSLGIPKKSLLTKMWKNFPEISWNEEYPIGGRPQHSAEHIQKRKDSFQETLKNRKHWNLGKKVSAETLKKKKGVYAAKKAARLKKMKPKIIRALKKHNNVRSQVANELGISRHCLWVNMQDIPEVDWKNDFPCEQPFNNEKV